MTVATAVGPCQWQTRHGDLTMADDKTNDDCNGCRYGDEMGQDDEVRVIDGGSPSHMVATVNDGHKGQTWGDGSHYVPVVVSNAG